MTMSIDGFGVARYQQNEYTSAGVVSTYSNSLQQLYAILQTPSTLPTDISAFLNAVNNLTKLAKNGQVDPSTGQTYYLLSPMLSDVKNILQSIKAVGIDLTNVDSNGNIIPPANIADIIQNWQSLSGFGISQIFIQAATDLDKSAPTRSLQSMIELEYVREGNEMISSALATLEQALQLTQNSMDSLTTLQNIANMISVQPRSYTASGGVFTAFGGALSLDGGQAGVDENGNFSYLGTITTYYKQQATAYFSQILPSAGGLTSTAPYELVQAKIDLMAQILKYESANPSVNRTTVNSLPYFLFQIVNDISASFKANLPATFYTTYGSLTVDNLRNANLTSTQKKAGAVAWVIDNQDQLLTTPTASLSGLYYGHLTQAIKGTQSLNDSKKQEVNNYMFLFQEFYKSSSSVLAQVSQIIVKMAQGINR